MNLHPDKGSDSHSLGGRFDRTQWTLIFRAREKGIPGAAEALEEVAKIYWPPLYSFIRRDGYSRHDAQDLTQGFYQHFLEKDLLKPVAEQKGKFRNYLLTCLKHFLSDARDRASALKRGGGKRIISLDALEVAERDAMEPTDGLTPDEIYERQWAEAILASAQEKLREKYASKGKSNLYEALKAVHLEERTDITYSEIAGRLRMSEAAVKSAAKKLRERFFKCVRKEVERTVSHSKEIDDEIRYLISVLARRAREM